MRVLPILFNTDMVRAILDGRKIVTRRVVKRKGYNEKIHNPRNDYAYKRGDGVWEIGYKRPNRSYPQCAVGVMQQYQPGDILYVRETWYEFCGERIYRATAVQPDLHDGMWKPSIHMPKEAARIFLKVKDVRVERLQECGKGWCLEIEKEGVVTPQNPILYSSDDKYHDALREEFQKLWDSTIKKSDLDTYGWNANPYVWVIEFERCEKPERG